MRYLCTIALLISAGLQSQVECPAYLARCNPDHTVRTAPARIVVGDEVFLTEDLRWGAPELVWTSPASPHTSLKVGSSTVLRVRSTLSDTCTAYLQGHSGSDTIPLGEGYRSGTEFRWSHRFDRTGEYSVIGHCSRGGVYSYLPYEQKFIFIGEP